MAATRLEVRLLGPLEIRIDGVARPLAGTRQRALVALLAVRANERLSSDRLADELWSESPPPAAQASLRVAIAKLRRVLGDEHRGLLATVTGGYMLSLDEQQLDSARFEALVAEAGARPPAAAAALLDEALTLWRGPPLPDLAGYAFARNEAARLVELRSRAREERADLELAFGRHEGLIAELTALVDESPYRERPRAQLMLALYRSGRQAEALDVYRRGRRQLRDELGLEPGEELRRLERAILAHDPAIGAPDVPARAAVRERPSRRGALAIAISAVVVAAATAGALLSHSTGHSAAAAAVPAHSLAVVAPATGGIARIRLGWTPRGVALSAQTLWMLDERDQTLSRLDLEARRVTRTIGLGITPTAVAVGDGAAWVLSAPQRTLIRVDPAYDLVRTTRVPLGSSSELSVGDPAGLAVARDGVWIEDGASTLFRVEPGTGAVTRRLVLGRGIDGVTVGAGSIWVTIGSPATVLRVDPRTGRVTARIPISTARGASAPYPIGVAFGSGSVWVLNGNTGTVSRIDPTLDAVTATVPRVSLNPIRIVAGAGGVWIGDGADGAVERIDPVTARVTRTVDVGGLPTSLAAGPAGVWVGVDAS